MDYWILFAILIPLGISLSCAYWLYRIALRIEETLQKIQACDRSIASSERSTLSHTMVIEANVKVLFDYFEARFGEADELARQKLLEQVKREHLSRQDTPVPAVIVTDKAMKILRATRLHS